MIKSLEPRVNISDEGSEFIVKVSVAGYAKNEINLEVGDNALTLIGNRKEDKKAEEDSYWKREFFCSNFKRYFDLGEVIDREHILTEVQDGILIVHLPKREKAQPKNIPIALNLTYFCCLKKKGRLFNGRPFFVLFP